MSNAVEDDFTIDLGPQPKWHFEIRGVPWLIFEGPTRPNRWHRFWLNAVLGIKCRPLP